MCAQVHGGGESDSVGSDGGGGWVNVSPIKCIRTRTALMCARVQRVDNI